MEKGDLIQTEVIRFYGREMIYTACVKFRNVLFELIDNGNVPADITVNATLPSEYDVKMYTPKVLEEKNEVNKE